MLLYKGMSMVLVEGGPKGIRRFSALMTRRINWSAAVSTRKEDRENIVKTSTPCVEIWQGITGSNVFREFVVENFEDETDVIKYLDQKKALGYWKQCKEYQEYQKFDLTQSQY